MGDRNMTATAWSSVIFNLTTQMLLTCGSDCKPFIRLPSYPATDDDSRGMMTMSSFFMFASRLATQDVTEIVEGQQGEIYITRLSTCRHTRPSRTFRERAMSSMHGRWRLLRVLSRFALRRAIAVWGLRTHRARCRPQLYLRRSRNRPT